MVVQKFGGTSVADADAIARLVGIVRAARDRDGRGPAVVVSAMSGVTDALLGIAAASPARTDEALAGVAHLRGRRLGSLSGGQLQRVWIAMVLAQETDVVCLDEPVNHLDMAHQLDCLDLVRRLNQEFGRTIVLVLHDLNLAARYADQLVFLSEGAIAASGTPEELMTEEMIGTVFNVRSMVITDPVHGRPLCIPLGTTTATSA